MRFLLRKLGTTVVGCLWLLQLSAQELFLHHEPASNVPKGALGVRFFAKTYNEFGQQRNAGTFRLMYGLTPKLTLMASATTSNHHAPTLPFDLITHTHGATLPNGTTQTTFFTNNIRRGRPYSYRLNGFYFYGKYRFLTIDGQNKHFRMAIYGEYSLVTSAHDEAEPNLLDDTKGYGGGLLATYLNKRFAVSLTAGMIIPKKYTELQQDPDQILPAIFTELQYGRAVVYDLAFGYLLYPKKYESYNQNNVNIYLEFIGRHYQAAQITQNGENVAPSAFALRENNYVEIYPGIQRIIHSNLRLDFSVGLPLIRQSYNHFYPVFHFGVQQYFYFNKKKPADPKLISTTKK
ncbi:MAG: hypothetical protein H7Y04_06890 [Verrucomicrobia bacterium]|nr:hypothetical protein [Cytophagales bacterium]